MKTNEGRGERAIATNSDPSPRRAGTREYFVYLPLPPVASIKLFHPGRKLGPVTRNRAREDVESVT